MLETATTLDNTTLVPIALVFGAVSTAVVITLWLAKKFNAIENGIGALSNRLQEIDELRKAMWTKQDQRLRELEWLRSNPTLVGPTQEIE